MLVGSEPAFEVAAVDDAEDEEDAVVGDEVVHDSVVADAEAVEGVCLAADRLHLRAEEAARFGRRLGELFATVSDPLAPDSKFAIPASRSSSPKHTITLRTGPIAFLTTHGCIRAELTPAAEANSRFRPLQAAGVGLMWRPTSVP